MKRICQFVHTLNWGGAETLAYRLATNPDLTNRYEFVFFCLDAENVAHAGAMAQKLIDQGYKVECLNRKPGLDRDCVKRLANLFEQYEIDIVHAHQCTPYFYSSLARWRKKNPKILLTEHGRFYPDVVSWKRRLVNRFLYRRDDILTAVGQRVKEALQKKEGYPGKRIQVIYNGIDPDVYDNHRSANENDTRESVRREFNIPDNVFTIIQVARLDPIKDYKTSLRTFEALRQTVPNIRLIIVGDGPERSAIEQGINRHNLQDGVIMTGARSDVSRLLKGADAFMLTSLSEGIPVTFLEAMAARLPIVTTDAGGCKEVVVNGQTGFVAPVGNPMSLAKALHLLATEPKLSARLGEAGRERLLEMFTQRQMHDAYGKLYEQLSAGGM
ncbi:MAG: glycosyltransferase [Thermoguttaceae bacterium]|nr:glycosyltransferase [Thermoguttaceae bacterium]